ncbi:trypsin-like [Ostrinia nubilalis]|uniref:trypsin-like n=1 Tax=Ostrinia nubilalis TaxID=29057 RepID=UPI0030822026
MIFVIFMLINTVYGDFFLNTVNHMEYYRNRTRPSKAFSSFSTNYFNQNSIKNPDKTEKVQCGTRTVDFNPRRTGKIVGGTETPYGAFPWQVEIQMLNVDNLNFEHHCGGAVIAERLVLSAAHCFDKPQALSSLCLQQPLQLDHIRLVVGEHRLKFQDKHENRFLAEKVVPHPDFRKNGPHSNDIALVVVSRAGSGVQFNTHVRPICLPEERDASAGRWCAVSGWGYQAESTESFAPVLRAASVPVLDLATCRKNQVLGGRQQAILDSMICAGVLSGGVDACRGDSGGPLACKPSNRWQLHGVVSWGSGCARRARPGVYTRVASYIRWIKSTAAALGHKIAA